jgi:hypothetical protein
MLAGGRLYGTYWQKDCYAVDMQPPVLCMQARTSNVPDFDFTVYAEQRLEQYHSLKRLKGAQAPAHPDCIETL